MEELSADEVSLRGRPGLRGAGTGPGPLPHPGGTSGREGPVLRRSVSLLGAFRVVPPSPVLPLTCDPLAGRWALIACLLVNCVALLPSARYLCLGDVSFLCST